MERKAGYYRVLGGAGWMVVEWEGASWRVPGVELPVGDNSWIKINEERIPMPGDVVPEILLLPPGVTLVNWLEITERINGFEWNRERTLHDRTTETKKFDHRMDAAKYMTPRILPTQFESKEEFEKAYSIGPIRNDTPMVERVLPKQSPITPEIDSEAIENIIRLADDLPAPKNIARVSDLLPIAEWLKDRGSKIHEAEQSRKGRAWVGGYEMAERTAYLLLKAKYEGSELKLPDTEQDDSGG